jgi:hypothetical protein
MSYLPGDEIFTDTYKMKLVDEVMYEISGKLVQRKEGEIILAGANASAEGEDAEDGGDTTGVETGVDIVLNHRLVETFAFDKKGYMAYLKEYMKKVVTNLQETAPDQVDIFKTNINKVIKDLLPRFKDLQLFTGILIRHYIIAFTLMFFNS